MFLNPLIYTLTAFVESIGIRAVAASSVAQTVFPGLDIQHGCVLVDEARVIYPGDILHEAGHLAVTDPQRRNAARLTPSGGDELSALAWSYAAALHLKLDPAVVFYPSSYHGSGSALLENFAAGRYIGVPMLQRYGMTVAARPTAKPSDKSDNHYPHMRKWLREG
jgi:hypothetical protein